jgi:quercetin dioxygenase-like cupin family protein
MAHHRLPFPESPWSQGGHPQERKKSLPGVPAILIAFQPGFRDPNVCVRGHSGYVLAGALQMDYEDGSEEYAAGEAFHIDPGTAHRAANRGPVPVVVFLVSTG